LFEIFTASAYFNSKHMINAKRKDHESTSFSSS